MFVRWQQYRSQARNPWQRECNDRRARLKAILVESVRVDGKPRQKHVAFLGSIEVSAVDDAGSGHAHFWRDVISRLNRVGPEDRKRITAVIAAKVGGPPTEAELEQLERERFLPRPRRRPRRSRVVRITQLDGKLPNLALMRLSHWHRERGDDVRFSRSPYRHLDEPAYGSVYGSAIFDYSREHVARLRKEFPGAVIGGTASGSNITVDALVGAGNAVSYDDYPTLGLRLAHSTGLPAVMQVLCCAGQGRQAQDGRDGRRHLARASTSETFASARQRFLRPARGPMARTARGNPRRQLQGLF